MPGVLLAGSLALGAAAGCGDDDTTPTTDSGTETDAGNTDAGADAGPADAGPVDAGPADAGEDSPVVAAYGIPPDAG